MSGKESKTIGKSIEETREYHIRYLRAINSPLRREILSALKEGCATLEDLQSSTGLDNGTLKWHLKVLEHASVWRRRSHKANWSTSSPKKVESLIT